MRDLGCVSEAQGSTRALAAFVEKVCQDPGQCVCSYQLEFTHCQKSLLECQTVSKATTMVTEKSYSKVTESERSTGAPCIEKLCAPCVIPSHLVDCPGRLETCEKALAFMNLSKNGSQGQVDKLTLDLEAALNDSILTRAELELCLNKSAIR